MTTEDSDYGYLLYMRKNDLQSTGLVKDGKITVEIITNKENSLYVVDEKEITLQSQ